MNNSVQNPEYVAKLFFESVNNGDRITAWKLLSSNSKNAIIENIYNEIQISNDVPKESKNIKKEHIQIAFENDMPGLSRNFWKGFAEAAYVKSISGHAEFIVSAKFENYVVVEILFKLPNLQQITIPLKVILEDSQWKVAYIESEIKNSG